MPILTRLPPESSSIEMETGVSALTLDGGGRRRQIKRVGYSTRQAAARARIAFLGGNPQAVLPILGLKRLLSPMVAGWLLRPLGTISIRRSDRCVHSASYQKSKSSVACVHHPERLGTNGGLQTCVFLWAGFNCRSGRRRWGQDAVIRSGQVHANSDQQDQRRQRQRARRQIDSGAACGPR